MFPNNLARGAFGGYSKSNSPKKLVLDGSGFTAWGPTHNTSTEGPFIAQ